MTLENKEHWRIQKHIPLSLMIMLGMQFVGFVWYAAKLDARIEFVERTQVEMRTDVVALQTENMSRRMEITEIMSSIRNVETLVKDMRQEMKDHVSMKN